MPSDSLWSRYQQLSPSRKFIVAVFVIWLVQALPKWTAAVTADGEMSAQIMKVFITPRTETLVINRKVEFDIARMNNQPE